MNNISSEPLNRNMPRQITAQAPKENKKPVIAGLVIMERGWYDISAPDKKIKYIFYPGDEVYKDPFYKKDKKQVDSNLSLISSLIREKLFSMPTPQKEEQSGELIRVEPKTYTIEDLNIGFLKEYDINTIYKGEEFMEDGTSYRKDGSILYEIESEAYGRIWHMTLLTENEEMAIIGQKNVLVLPSYFSRDNNAPLFEYGYSTSKSSVIDYVLKQPFQTTAIIHTHPNGSGPSGLNGDGSFMANHFPFKPNYVMMIKKDNLDQSSIAFIVGSESPYNSNNGYSGYANSDLDRNLTINNLIRQPKGYPLKDFTIQNKMNFKLLIPKFRSK